VVAKPLEVRLTQQFSLQADPMLQYTAMHVSLHLCHFLAPKYHRVKSDQFHLVYSSAEL